MDTRRCRFRTGLAWIALVLSPVAPMFVEAQDPDIRIEPDEILADSVAAADVELSAFGSYLALYDSTEGNSIRLFDRSFSVLWRHRMSAYWAGSWDPGSVIQFSPDETRLLFPGYRNDNDIAVVDSGSGELLTLLTEHDQEEDVLALALSPDGRRLVSATRNELFVWEAEGDGYVPVVQLRDYAPYTASIEWFPDGHRFALSGRSDQQRFVQVYQVDPSGTLQEGFSYEFSDNNISHDIYQIAISPDGDRIAAGYRDRLILLDVESGAAPVAVSDIDIGTVYSLLFTPSGGEIVTAHSRYLRVWRVQGDLIRSVLTVPSQRPVAQDIELSRDGRYLYLASEADSNALSRYAVEGIAPSPLGAVVDALGWGLSPAQRRVLTEESAAGIISTIDPDRLYPRDMFETVEEYEARRSAVSDEIRRRVAELMENRFVSNTRRLRSGIVEIESEPNDRGEYDVDRGRYSISVFGTTAWLSIDRDAARELYRRWEGARARATRTSSATGAPEYSDFRLAHPTNGSEYPLVFAINPFTGESLPGGERRIPVVAVGPYLEFRDLRLEGIFPALYRSYANQPLGAMTIVNTGTGIVTDVTVSVAIPALQTGRREIGVPRSIAAGRSIDAEITLPVGPSILGPAGARSVTLEFDVRYSRNTEHYSETITRELPVLNRNAIRWSDDRRVGAFMSVEDPAIVEWSSGLVGAIDRPATNLLTQNMLAALYLFEALAIHGINYVVDPASAYEDLSADSFAIDYLRFPQETLNARAGDCDDLSVLYATLLEAVGVPTAYITTPGHIFVAVDLGIDPNRARSLFSQSDALILTEEESWLPVETTLISEGFVRAWQTGALQWRRSYATGEAQLFSSRDAWRRYPPVVGIETPPDPAPSATAVEIEAARRLAEFRQVELDPQRVALEENRAGRSPEELANRLGVLYAEFGLFDEAASYFDEAIGDNGYVPALINRANVAALQGRDDEARRYLERASAREPANARVLLGLAYAHWRSGDRDEARRAYDQVVQLRPALAERYPLFDGAGDGADAASDSGGTGRAARSGRASNGSAGDELFGADWY